MNIIGNNSLILEFLNDFINISSHHTNILLLSHDNIDPDGLGSILGIMDFLDQINPNMCNYSIYPRSLSVQSKKVLESLGIEIPFIGEELIIPEDPLCILLDINDVSRIPLLKTDKEQILAENILIIDHHQTIDVDFKSTHLILPSASSNAEIVTRLFHEKKITPRFPANIGLLCGILFDSKFLKHATNETISSVKMLLNTGIELSVAREMLVTEMDVSEKIARLKAAMRCVLTRVNDTIIATSEVGSYESSACRALLSLGADISIVLADHKNEVRISSRQTESCYRKHGINLASVMNGLSKVVDGSGGGHAMAAGLKGVKDGKVALDKAIKTITDILEAKDEAKR